MSSKVYTQTICDRCEDGVHTEEKAECDVPPVEWAVVILSYRAEGAGWSGGGKRIQLTLCPRCASSVEAAIKRPAEGTR